MKFFILLFSILAMTAPFTVQAKTSFGIAATVNTDAVSESDVNDRMKLIFASSGIQDTPESRNKVRPQALNILIEEQLKIQEAKKNNIEISSEEIDKAFGTMAAQNKMEPDQFKQVMANSGIPHRTLRRQIEAQIAWQKVVSRVLRPRVDVTDNDINARLDRLKENVGKTEYQVSEIFLPVNSNNKEAKVKDLSQKLVEEIKLKRAPFPVVATQFSKSASAVQGGSLGWVQEGELPKELDIVVKSLSKGQISPPIKGLSGYYILTLNGQRTISEENLPSEEEVLNSIGLQRLDRLQKRYLSDLRSSSFIERRK